MSKKYQLQRREKKASMVIFVILGVLLLTGASCGSSVGSGGVLRSDDIAETWTVKNFIGQDGRRAYTIDPANINKLRIDPKNTQVLYAATKENGLYKSENGGDQWYQLSIASGLIRDIQIHPESTSLLYATLNNQIILSRDGGTTWEGMYTDGQGALITRLAIDWFNPNRVFATTSIGTVLLTEDGGNNWRVVYDITNQISDLVISTQDSRTIYITEYDKSLHKTTDGGVTWVDVWKKPERQNDKAWQEFQQKHPGVTNIRTMSLDANNPSILYLGTRGGLIRTTDGGDTWSLMRTLIAEGAPENESIRNILTIPTAPHILIFTLGNQIHKSIDSGLSWKTIDNFPTPEPITTIAVDQNQPSLLYSGTEQPPKERRSLFPTPGQ